MPEPIEITAKDIIKRPLNALTDAAGPKKGNFISQIKSGMEQVKEIKKILDDLGINVGDLIGGTKQTPVIGMNTPPRNMNTPLPEGIAPAPAPAAPAAPTPQPLTVAQQAKNFLALLRLRYGDISVNELLEKLKAEFGEKKLSDFIK